MEAKELKSLVLHLRRRFRSFGFTPKVRYLAGAVCIGTSIEVRLSCEGLIEVARVSPIRSFVTWSGGGGIDDYTINVIVRESMRIYNIDYQQFSLVGLISQGRESHDMTNLNLLIEDGMVSAKALIEFRRRDLRTDTKNLEYQCQEDIALINKLCNTKYETSGWWLKKGGVK